MKARTPAKRVRAASDKARLRRAQSGARGSRRTGNLDGTTHITPAGGNVFADLGFAPAEAENLKIRSNLMDAVCERIADMSQVDAASLLGVSQPRVSDLARGKIGHFTIDALVNMLACAGVRVRIAAR